MKYKVKFDVESIVEILEDIEEREFDEEEFDGTPYDYIYNLMIETPYFPSFSITDEEGEGA